MFETSIALPFETSFLRFFHEMDYLIKLFLSIFGVARSLWYKRVRNTLITAPNRPRMKFCYFNLLS